ncbi:MAG TPA: carboxypeptidase regulatory-like domain-containing protein [Gemmatimonadaceae bacterium]|nr:carboxypeptidase regulatory-like domain-containing protein [Gemmatimonadaceae bacterium]
MTSLISVSRLFLVALATIPAIPSVGEAQLVATAGSPRTDSSAVFSGVYSSTARESIFSPCDVPGIGSGWWLRFDDPREGVFLKFPFQRFGMPTLTHFIRVRGRVSDAGRYGLGFQTREILVDSVLEVKDTPQPCASYEDVPQPWSVVKSSGARIVGTAVSDDRTLVAVLDLEGFINVWNTKTGTLVKRFYSEEDVDFRVVSQIHMAFTPDGRRLAVAGTDGVVRVWNPHDGQRMWMLAAIDTMGGSSSGRKSVMHSEGLSFNQAGTLLANMLVNRVAIWSMTTGERFGTHAAGWAGNRLLFLGDSSFIVSGDSGLMRIHPRLGAPPIWRIGAPGQRTEVMEKSPDGRWLAFRNYGDTAQLWSLADGQPGKKIALPNFFSRNATAFSPDGSTIAMSSGTSAIYVWDTKTGRPLTSFRKYPMHVEKLWFTADGKSIVSHSISDSVFRIVHLGPPRDSRGSPVIDREPVQASWGAYLPPGSETTGRPLGSISGFVADSAGKAIVGADVSLFDGDRPGSRAVAKASTNAAGRFLLQDVTVRHPMLRAAKRGFGAATRYTHLPAEQLTVDFVLKLEKRRR